MNNSFSIKGLLFFLGLVLFVSSCKNDDDTSTVENYQGKKSSEYDANIPNAWYAHTLNLVRTTKGYSPPVASRALGYIGVTLYEAVRPGNLEYKTMVGQLTDLNNLPRPENNKEYYWPAAANAALARINTLLFPQPESKKALFDSIQVIKNYYQIDYRKTGISEEAITRSELFGEAIANAVFEWSAADYIGHEGFRKNFPASYQVPTGLGKWVPTNSQKIPLQPYWGSARAFVPGSINASTPTAPYNFSTDITSAFYKEGNEVFTTVKNATAEQKKIAFYWADGGGTITPPGHSVAITRQLIGEFNYKLDRAAEAYMRIGIGVADAFICCWKCKYVYNVIRPESYIQKYIEPTFKPLLETPPFPEYTSGHSSQSGATAYILSRIFGENVPVTDKTHQNRTDIDGTPRQFSNFMEMAKEAAVSRLYGGIHYRKANDEGLASGLKIGKSHDVLNIK